MQQNKKQWDQYSDDIIFNNVNFTNLSENQDFNYFYEKGLFHNDSKNRQRSHSLNILDRNDNNQSDNGKKLSNSV